MERKNIIVVAPIYDNLIGGLKYSVPNMAKSLKKSGNNVCIITTNKEKYTPDKDYGIPVFHYYKTNEKSNLKIKDLIPPFNKPDIILFQSTYIVPHWKLSKEAIKLKVPYIITPRGGMTKEAQKQKKLKKILGNVLFFKKLVRNSKAIHCLTHKESEDLTKWNIPYYIVPNGINLAEKSVNNEQKKESLNISFIGRMDINHKGLDILVEALKIVNEKHPFHNINVDLYGPQVANSHFKLKELIKLHGISHFVKVHNSVNSIEKDRIFRNSQLFVHTSRFEGHPVSVLEAMSYGVPVLVTPGTNITTVIDENEAGWSAEENPISIANCLLEIVLNEDKCKIKGRNARALAEREYSWDIIGDKINHELNKILDY